MWRVIGQEKVVSLLRSSLEKGVTSHAYLFSGPACVGKMTLALELAKALNCRAADPPCGECDSCRKIGQGKHADIQVISLNSADSTNGGKNQTEISIEQIRQLQHSASLPPFEGKCRVFIIDEAEFLSIEAANCLLKTLEEPESRVVFILLTCKICFIPETVISRCQWLKLAPVTASEIESALCSRWGVEPQKARLLARMCKGCIGWAVSAAENDDFLTRHYETRNKIPDIMFAGSEERFAYAAQLATQFSQKRDAVQDVLCLWLDLWRDILLTRVGCGEAVTNIDLEEKLNLWAEGYSLGEIRKFIGDIRTAAEQLRQNASPRLVLEVLMLNIPGRKRERVVG